MKTFAELKKGDEIYFITFVDQKYESNDKETIRTIRTKGNRIEIMTTCDNYYWIDIRLKDCNIQDIHNGQFRVMIYSDELTWLKCVEAIEMDRY